VAGISVMSLCVDVEEERQTHDRRRVANDSILVPVPSYKSYMEARSAGSGYCKILLAPVVLPKGSQLDTVLHFGGANLST
jgi:hypothetical protein